MEDFSHSFPLLSFTLYVYLSVSSSIQLCLIISLRLFVCSHFLLSFPNPCVCVCLSRSHFILRTHWKEMNERREKQEKETI